MIDDYELQMIWKEALMAYPNISLEGLRKTAKIVGQYSLCPGQDLNGHLPDICQKYYHLNELATLS